jgi:rRNA maturation endonuclease Nob1
LGIKEYVTDSNIFYMGIPFQSDPSSKYYITSEILNEIIHIKSAIGGLNVLISLGKVVVQEPFLENTKYIMKKIRAKGQYGLSKPDCSLIALSLQLKLPLISTDYALINMAKYLSIDTIIPGKTHFDIQRTKKFCSICKKFFSNKYFYCNICGNKLIFKRFDNS